MPDSTRIRIPMACGIRRETLRFAWRNEVLVLPVFQPRRGAKRPARSSPFGERKKVAQRRRQAHEIIGARNIVRALEEPRGQSCVGSPTKFGLGGERRSLRRGWR